MRKAGMTSSFIERLKHWALLTIAGLIIVVAFQNQLAVTIRVLFWTVDVSRFALVVVTFAAGALCGWLIKSLRHESHPAIARDAGHHPSTPADPPPRDVDGI